VGWAEHATAAQLDRIVSAAKRARRTSDVRARRAARHVTYSWDEDGSLVGSFRLAPEDGVRFLKGLEVATDLLPEPEPAVEAAEDESLVACQECQDSPSGRNGQTR